MARFLATCARARKLEHALDAALRRGLGWVNRYCAGPMAGGEAGRVPPNALGASSEWTALARMGDAGAFSIVGNSVSPWRSSMSKSVGLTIVAVSFVLAAGGPASAGQPHPLCPSFWKDACEDPFGFKAACAAAPAPTCPAPAAAPATEPVAPPTTPESPPAPTTAQNTTGRQRSFSYDPTPGSQPSAARTSSRPVARPANAFRADRKMRGF
jgi:hypothetical protein